MAFGRQTQEQIYNDMQSWAQGVNPTITDYRVGGKYRTLLESVGYVLEKFYDRVFKGLKDAIATALYTALGFARLPAVASTGTVTFSIPAALTSSLYIPTGTIVQVPATATVPPIQFMTSQDAWVAAGNLSVDVPVTCLTTGTIGNVSASSITQFATTIAGVSSVTNANAITNGQDEESLSQQRYRFSLYIKSRARGTLLSMQYAATTVTVTDPVTGNITEQVRQAVATEGAGTASVYVWNGTGAASSTLLGNVTKELTGYIDPTLGYVYGYKPAGTTLSVATMPQASQNVLVHVVAEPGYSFNVSPVPANTTDLTPAVGNAISSFFSNLVAGQMLIWSQLEAAIQNIPGVQEVVFNFIPDPSAALTLAQDAATTSTLTATTYYVENDFRNAHGQSMVGKSQASIAVSTAGHNITTTIAIPAGCTKIGVYVGTATSPLLLGIIDAVTGAVTYSGTSAAGLAATISGGNASITISAAASATGAAPAVQNSTGDLPVDVIPANSYTIITQGTTTYN